MCVAARMLDVDLQGHSIVSCSFLASEEGFVLLVGYIEVCRIIPASAMNILLCQDYLHSNSREVVFGSSF